MLVCHQNKTTPCVYVGWFINKSAFYFFLSSHFSLKVLNPAAFSRAHQYAEPRGWVTWSSEAANRCHLDSYIYSVGAAIIHSPVAHRKHCSALETQMILLTQQQDYDCIHSFMSNIVLGTAKCWGYTHENGKHNSNNNNNDIAAKQPHWTGTLRQHRILHHLDFSKILWGGYNLLFYRYEILGPKAMFLLSHSRVA